MNAISARLRSIPAGRLADFVRSANGLMFAVMLVIGLACVAWSERLLAGDGLGWDGSTYASWVADLRGNFLERGVTDYYAQRVLPSAVVHYGMRLFGVPFDNPNIIRAFDVLNLFLVMLSVYLWGRIADELRLSNPGKWFGFCTLFLNYAILKNNFYHSVLTDTSAFALGFITFYCFLKDKPLGLVAVMVISGFTWPTGQYFAALLLVLPRQDPSKSAPLSPSAWRAKMGTVFAWIVCGIVYAAFVHVLQPENFATWMRNLTGIIRVDQPLILVSLAAAMLYLFFAVRTVADNEKLFHVPSIFRAVRWWRLLAALAILVLLKLGARALSNGVPHTWNLHSFLVHTLLSALTEPAIFLVAHTIYYGPVFVLLVLLWRPFCRAMREFGPGFELFVIINVILSINPQSRYFMNVASCFAIVLVWMLDRSGIGIRYRDVFGWALLCVAYSKIWYRFNTGPPSGTPFDFPLQHYFMNTGPWMMHGPYLAQGAAVLATAVLLFAWIKFGATFQPFRRGAHADIVPRP